MEEQCHQTSTTVANSGQTIGERIKKKKHKKLLLFFKYLYWKNVFFKRPNCKCLRLCRGSSWPLLQIFLLLFFLSFKKIIIIIKNLCFKKKSKCHS